MLRQGGGRIVMIASIAGKRGAPYIAAYSAAKHAQLGLVRSLAEEFRAKNIVVNAVCPHYVDTPMTGRSIDNIVKRTGKSPEETRAMLGAMNPQGRLITPAEVAGKALEFALSTCKISGEALDL
jgi:NAD(P)-dependent dehydrogenase (short-subunit alcohol dehydrogenase family)